MPDPAIPPQPASSVDAQLAVIDHKVTTLLVQRDDHETRIRRLEKWIWVATGVAAAAGSAGGQLLAAAAR